MRREIQLETTLPNRPRSVLDLTVDVLRKAEHLLIQRAHVRWKKAEVIIDSVWHGPSFVIAGLAVQMRLLGVGVLLVAIWWVALLAVSLVTDHTVSGWVSTGGTALVMATASLVFRMPSAGSLHGVRRTAVVLLAAHICDACPNEVAVSALKANLSSLSNISEKQTGRIQAILGLYWAALVWWVATWVLPIDVTQATRNEAASWACLGAFFFIVAGMMSIGYATASRIFWQTIGLALSEVEARTVQAGTPLPDGVTLERSRPA